jgi:hypothetical protein
MNGLLRAALEQDVRGYQHVLHDLRRHDAGPRVCVEVYQLLMEQRFLEAYMTARLYRGVGTANVVVHIACAVGGFLFGDPQDERNSVAELAAFVDSCDADARLLVSDGIMRPVIQHIVLRDASLIDDADRALRLLEITKAGSMTFRTLFNWDEVVAPLNVPTSSGSRRPSPPLVSIPDTLNHEARCSNRAVVAVRERVFPDLAASRLYDMGPRIVAAMSRYGWTATHFPLGLIDYDADIRGMLAACEAAQADLLLIDEPIQASGELQSRAQFITTLRQNRPGIRIISLQFDPWGIPRDVLQGIAAIVDGVWTNSPSMPIWDDRMFAGKMIYVPFPHAGQGGITHLRPTPDLTLSGGIFAYNWPRIFWLATKRHGIPINFVRSNHQSDDMSVLDSYAAYMKRLASTGCSLNFSMRQDGSRVLTGRLFETLLAGALLVQEDTDDAEHYVVPGEHYLRFSSVAELRAIVQFIAEQPEQADIIRRRGNAFAHACYNDDRLISAFDIWLREREPV